MFYRINSRFTSSTANGERLRSILRQQICSACLYVAAYTPELLKTSQTIELVKAEAKRHGKTPGVFAGQILAEVLQVNGDSSR